MFLGCFAIIIFHIMRYVLPFQLINAYATEIEIFNSLDHKAHRNGIHKPKKNKYPSLKGVSKFIFFIPCYKNVAK